MAFRSDRRSSLLIAEMMALLNSERWAGIGFLLVGEGVVATMLIVIAIGRHV